MICNMHINSSLIISVSGEHKDKQMLKEYKTLFRYMKPYRLWYVGGVISLVFSSGSQLLVPQFIRQAIDTLTLADFELSTILTIILYMMLTAVGIALGRLGWRYFLGTTARRIETSLRGDLFDHLMTLDSSFYQENSIGDLMARSTNDMQTVRMASGMALVAFLDGLFLTAAVLVIMFTQTPELAAFVIIPMPILAVIIVLFGRAVGPRFKLVQEGFSKLSDHSQETFSGIRVIKSFVKEKYFLKRFSVFNDEYRAQNMKLVTISGLFFPLTLFFSGLTTMLLLFFGGRQVINNQISPGELVATLSYLQMLVWPMIGAGFTIILIQRGAASLERINRIMDYKPRITNVSPDVKADLNGTISIEDLSISHNEQRILENISFTIPESSFIGLTGPVGSGKTTLLNCLPRLADWDEGRITINGHDTKTVDLYYLRSCFGYVPQRSFLFSANLRDNIAFGRIEGISDEELEHLTRTASLDQDFKLFPHGWDTVVGEKGVAISGGQKQRSSLARALASRPSILLLDDPLSAVDADTEERILTALLKQVEGKTAIIVSHRISTLKHCDNVLVLEDGRITQQGHHDTLKEEEGYYHNIFEIQKTAPTPKVKEKP